MHLWDPSKAIVFKPTVRMDAQHVDPVLADPKPLRPQHAIGADAPDRLANLDCPEPVVSRTVNDMDIRRDSVAPDAEPSSILAEQPVTEDDVGVEQSSDSDYVPSQEQGTNVNGQPADDADATIEEIEEEAEEHIDLTYKIPEDTLRAAMLASPNTRASFWSARLYRGPDGQSLITHYCRSLEVAERVAQHFLNEKVLGFDIEWRPFSGVTNIKLNASLIQLACEDRVALFHISQFQGSTPEELMPPTLKIILENPNIYKVGVAVKGDFSRLRKYLNVEAHGVFELSRLHNLVELHATDPTKLSKKLIGLSAQVLQHLQLPLYKGEQLQDDPDDTANVRRSDWSKLLDVQQIHYAASDAYAGFRLFHILEWKRKQLRPTPPIQGICDDDEKPATKSTAPKKKNKAAAKATPVTGTDEQSASAFEEEQESELEPAEEEGGYETAPEDIMDSHELEDPVAEASSVEQSATANDTFKEASRARLRVGRVSLPWQKGPDPDYPTLPQELDENVGTSSRAVETAPKTAATPDTPLSTPDVTKEDDDFEDPELDAVLQDMELDEEGTLQLIATPEPDQPAPKTTSGEMDSVLDTDTESTDLPHPSNDTDFSDYMTSDTDTPSIPPTFALLAPNTPQYTTATRWAQSYLSTSIPSPSSPLPARIRATISHLRAYHLWHHQGLSLKEVASLLREPPLSLSTVAGHVLQAVSLEGLDVEVGRLREVVQGLPIGMRMGRWKGMVERVERGGVK
jgi:hypothetical protein